jgi:diadenosine tetraphosphate (Ap4A) HIT family hydrolase
MNQYPTLIHERIALAREGKNKTVIARVSSGWVVLGDDQRLRGYCVLLADPIVDNLNELDEVQRKQFLWDMSAVGDALMSVLKPSIVNYSILGNIDRALHVHIHPRYNEEEEANRKNSPLVYWWKRMPVVPFDLGRDKPLMDSIREELSKRTTVLE